MQGMLVYEDKPPVEWWLKLIYIGSPLITFALGLYFLYVDIIAAIIMFAITVFDSILFRYIIPRSYQIYTDRLVIALYPPISKTILFSDIKSAQPASSSKTRGYGGMKLTTSMKGLVVIERYHGMDVVISPGNREMFLEQLNQAIKMYS